jgi:hypothetical protein
MVIATVLGLALIGGLWRGHHPAHPAPVNASIYETDMTEGLVRGFLPECAACGQGVCFLAFGEGTTSPSRTFIARFAGSRPVVRSCGSAVSPLTGKYFETATGRPGLVIRIIRFKEIIPGTFDVLVGFSNLPPGHDRFTCRISNLAGEWVIKSRKPA